MTPELRKALREAVELVEAWNALPEGDEHAESDYYSVTATCYELVSDHADELLSLVGEREPFASAFSHPEIPVSLRGDATPKVFFCNPPLSDEDAAKMRSLGWSVQQLYAAPPQEENP